MLFCYLIMTLINASHKTKKPLSKSIICYGKDNDQDSNYSQMNKKKKVTITSFYNEYYQKYNFKRAMDYCLKFYDQITGDRLHMNNEVNKYFKLHQRRFPTDQAIPQHMKSTDRDLISQTFKTYVKSAFFDKKVCKDALNWPIFKGTDEEKKELAKDIIKIDSIMAIIESFEENKGDTNRGIVILLADHIVEDFMKLGLKDHNIDLIIEDLKNMLLISEKSCIEVNKFLNERVDGRLDYLEYFGFIPPNIYLKVSYWAKNIYNYLTSNEQTELPEHLLKVKNNFEKLEETLRNNFIEKIIPDLGVIYYSLIIVEFLNLDKYERKPKDQKLELLIQIIAHIELFISIIGYIHDIPFLLRNQGCLRFSINSTEEIIITLKNKIDDINKNKGKSIKGKNITMKFTEIFNKYGSRGKTFLINRLKFFYKNYCISSRFEIKNLITLMFLSTYKYSEVKKPENKLSKWASKVKRFIYLD